MRRRVPLALAGVLSAVALTAGCSGEEPGTTGAAGDPARHQETFGHIHGLGVNPADDRLYVASHLGVFRESDAGFERIADRRQDTMAFIVTGPDRFLASGHPDPREGGPSHLGLVGTTDAAETWQPLGMAGASDFHTLEVGGSRLYGFDSLTETLIASEDGQTWTDVLRAPLLDFVVDPEDPNTLVVADERGVLMRLEAGSQPQAIDGAPQVGLLDWSPDGDLAGLGPSGEVWLSEDGGTSWSEVGAVPGSPQALSIDADPWYVASDQGLFSSTDQGRSWEPVPLT